MKQSKFLPAVLSLVFVSGMVFAACKSDCRDNYDEARDQCTRTYADADDADALKQCIDDAKAEYENCIEECES